MGRWFPGTVAAGGDRTMARERSTGEEARMSEPGLRQPLGRVLLARCPPQENNRPFPTPQMQGPKNLQILGSLSSDPPANSLDKTFAPKP